GLWGLLVALGAPSIAVLLATGIYMATSLDAWTLDWVRFAVPALVLVAVAGGVVGPRRSRFRKSLEGQSGPLSPEMEAACRHPSMTASWRLRAALLTGLLFVMTVKPTAPSALVWLAVFVAAGAAWGLLAWAARKNDAGAGVRHASR